MRDEPVAATLADLLRRPIVVVAIAALLLNDHVLKAAFPGPVTGKLSDVAGLVVFPVLLAVATWPVLRRTGWSTGLMVGAAALVTGAGFALTKTWTPANEAYQVGLGFLQWLVGLPVAALVGSVGQPHRVGLAMDASDLVALPAVLVPWLLVCRAPPCPATPGQRTRPASSRRRAVVPVAALIVGGAACLASSVATPQDGLGLSLAGTLDVARPARAEIEIELVADPVASPLAWEEIDVRLDVEGAVPVAWTGVLRLMLVEEEGDVLLADQVLRAPDADGWIAGWGANWPALRDCSSSTGCRHRFAIVVDATETAGVAVTLPARWTLRIGARAGDFATELRGWLRGRVVAP